MDGKNETSENSGTIDLTPQKDFPPKKTVVEGDLINPGDITPSATTPNDPLLNDPSSERNRILRTAYKPKMHEHFGEAFGVKGNKVDKKA